MAKIDLFGYPDQFSVVVPEGTVFSMITPSDSYYLRVRNGQVEKELYWNDNIVSADNQGGRSAPRFSQEGYWHHPRTS